MNHSLATTALIAPLLNLCLASALPAEEEGAAEWAFAEIIDVRVIEVEVVVSDGEGKRVEGLGREDFRLRVDGRPVEIEFFNEWIDRGAARAREPRGSDVAPEGRRFLVFIDDYFTSRRYRAAVLEKMAEDLDQLGPADRMAIVRFGGRQLELVSDWSASAPELGALLRQAKRKATGELPRQNRLRTSGGGVDHVELLEQQVKKVSSTVTAALRSFADAPGRKVLLLVSSGWPYDLPARRGPGVRFAQQRRGGLQLLQPVVDTANLLGFTIYPMHIGFDRHGSTFGGGSSHHSLDYLARASGGVATSYATVAKAPFARVVEDTASYYVLGFTPTWQGNDAQHSIQVTVAGRGYVVRHRRGFKDLSRRTQVSMSAEAALLLGTAGPELEVSLGTVKRTGFSRVKVPVEVRIPMDWATVLPSGGKYASALELRVAALDAKGDRSEMPVIPILLTGPKPAPGSHSIYSATLQLRRRAQRLVLSLHDQPSGESLTTTLDLDPKK